MGSRAPKAVSPTGPADPSADPTDPAAAGAAPPSRAGRNLPLAIAVGLAMGGVLIASLLTVRQTFIGIVAVSAAVGTWELFGALHRSAGIRLSRVPVLVGGQAVIWLAWPFGAEGILGALVATVLGCFLWRMRLGAPGFVRDAGATMLVLVWVPLFMAFGTMLVVPADGAARAMTFLLVVVCSDTGGYAAGVLFGRHPMAPRVSPKKSWEGFGGSVLVGGAGAVACLTLLLDAPWWTGLVLGPAVVAAAVIGDLVESLIKRDLGIKDMGQTIPGHGGLMERLDSVITAAPVAWLLLYLLVPGG